MGKCYFCYCKDCAMLRRWLLTYSPEKCCNILKRTLTRDDKQIDYKINQEIKKIVLSELPTINEKVEEEVEESSLKSKLRPRKSK